MSGDVQPRKRKDKKRKRDSLDRKSEGELFARKLDLKEDEEIREHHHGVHATKMGTDDIHLHIQGDTSTGGHWCAKVFFFSLLAILFGLIGLIILENRGLSDLDTPLSESRFSEYFDGWVDEHRQAHDEHVDKVMEAIKKHDHDAEPFDEEENNSEQADDDENNSEQADDDENNSEQAEDDENNSESHDDHDDEEEPDEEHEEENEVETAEPEDEEDDEDQSDGEEDNEQEDEENEFDEDDSAGDDEDEEQEIPQESTKVKRDTDDVDEGFEDAEPGFEDAEPDDDDDTGPDDNEDDDNESVVPPQDDDSEKQIYSDHDPFDEHVTNKLKTDVNNNEKSEKITPKILEKQVDELYEKFNRLAKSLEQNKAADIQKVTINNVKRDIKEDDFDDDDESLEQVVDNDAGEFLHLQEKAKQEEENSKINEPVSEEESEGATLAVKIGVGLALAFVARLVLVKKKSSDKTTTTKLNYDDEILLEEPISVRRRFTMISAADNFPADEEEEELLDDDEEFSEEGYEDEEEELEEEQEVEIQKTNEEKIAEDKFKSDTFEELNALYRPTGYGNLQSERIEEIKPIETFYRRPIGEMKKPETIQKPKEQSPIQSYVKIDYEPKVETKSIPQPQQIPQTAAQFVRQPTPQLIGHPTSQTTHQPVHQQSPPVSSAQQLSHQQPSAFTPPASSLHDLEYDDDEDLIDEGGDEEEDLYGDEELEEEEEEELDSDNEDLSDVDDDDLMKRLEAKYGKLPQKEYNSEDEEDLDHGSWTKVKRGSQSVNEDSFIDDELNRASDEMLQNNLKSALNICESILLKYPKHPGALFGKAKILDRLSQKYMSNEMLKEAISIYVKILSMDDQLNDDDFKEAAERCIDRMRFIGLHLKAIPIHKLLIKRFKDLPQYRNELAVTLLLINRLSEAKYILHRTLLKWRNDGFAQVHYGFVLKNLDQDLEGAVKFLQQGIESEAKGTQDGRFYFNLGDALQRLGRRQEAIEIYRKGAKKELFLSEYQRSLYNVNDLKGQPFWTKHETTYEDFFNIFERNWRNIRNEGLNVLNEKGYFKNEVENLKDTGDWKQFELYTRGTIISKNCLKTPLTCKLIQTFPAARTCKRGQIKFSVIHSGTHVWPHCGPTNCRLRAHLGLKVPSGTSIRVADVEKTWEEGKFLIFDDSFEHEVWHNGTGVRLVLIVDVWHPELSESQRNNLSPI